MILTALKQYYDRLAAHAPSPVPPYGYSDEKISFALVLDASGQLLDVEDWRDSSGKKPAPKLVSVPRAAKRTSGVLPNFLWDKTSYVLGVKRDPKTKEIVLTPEEHQAFKELHFSALSDTTDQGLRALIGFLNQWDPNQYPSLRHTDDMLDANIVFRLSGEERFLHQRPAAAAVWSKLLVDEEATEGFCLVTGEKSPIARLHPPIKGVAGAQTSGASIVSFNLDAFTSYGKDQGGNAPVSEAAAFAYGTVLNHMLRPGEHARNRLRIGDATVIFWAEASGKGGEAAAEAAEDLFAMLADPPVTDDDETVKVRDTLQRIALGKPIEEAKPGVRPDTRFYVLGLAPNASRLSVRYWLVDDFGVLAARFADHFRDLTIEPTPRDPYPPIWRLLRETAAQGKSENIPPQLAGEVMRSILTGARYPTTLFTSIITRCRADQTISDLRAAILKACLARQVRLKHGKEAVPMSLDTNETNPGYRLGRLFAVLEGVQRQALPGVNATIRDRYYGAASATPAAVFPVLLRNANHHLSNIRKSDKGGLASWFESQIADILSGLGSSLPKSLRIEDQGRFAIGYYQQRFNKKSDPISNDDNTDEA